MIVKRLVKSGEEICYIVGKFHKMPGEYRLEMLNCAGRSKCKCNVLPKAMNVFFNTNMGDAAAAGELEQII